MKIFMKQLSSAKQAVAAYSVATCVLCAVCLTPKAEASVYDDEHKILHFLTQMEIYHLSSVNMMEGKNSTQDIHPRHPRKKRKRRRRRFLRKKRQTDNI